MAYQQRPFGLVARLTIHPPSRLHEVFGLQKHHRAQRFPRLPKTLLVRAFHPPRRKVQSLSLTCLACLPAHHRYRFPASVSATLVRSVSTSRSRWRQSAFLRFCLRAFTFAGIFGLTVTGFIVAFFIYDATTYRESMEQADVPISELALRPRRGGPKNLPIADSLVDDQDSPETVNASNKPRLVILGGGWGVSLTPINAGDMWS